MINETGAEILALHTPELKAEMIKRHINLNLINQIILVLDCSTIKKYLFGNGKISISDLNNLISQIVNSTGLRDSAAFSVAKLLFETAGIEFLIEPSPYLSNDKKITYGVRKVIPEDICEKKLELAMQYIQKSDTQSKGYEIITELAEAGVPRALYLLGKYYYDLAKNEESVDIPYIDYLIVAAEQGVSEASVILGDIYYKHFRLIGHDNTKAFYFYSKPGVSSFDLEHQEKIKDIFAQRKKNLFTVIFEIIFIVLMLVFLIIFNQGIVYGESKIFWGILNLLMSIGVLIGSIFYNKKFKYNSLKWSLGSMGMIWSWFLLVLVMG